MKTEIIKLNDKTFLHWLDSGAIYRQVGRGRGNWKLASAQDAELVQQLIEGRKS